MSQSYFPARDPKKSISQSETEILKYWQDADVFKQSVDSRHPKRSFVFFDGPPFATGTPHYGHILAGTIKDTIPRYWTMKGYQVQRKFGWDCHGLPVEYQVEKEKQIGGKPGIEAMGVDKFNELCRSIVLRCRDEWEDTVARMGRFVDFKNDYKTMDPEFMESVWWVFKQLWDKGLIYEGHKVVAYSPKLGSPLSNFEANLNYQDIDDPAVTIKFKLGEQLTVNGEQVSLRMVSTDQDWEQYTKLMGEHFYNGEIKPKSYYDHYLKTFGLFDAENNLVATSALRVHPEDPEKAELRDIVTVDAKRRQKLGTQMCYHAFFEAKNRGFKTISIEATEDAWPFYDTFDVADTGKAFEKHGRNHRVLELDLENLAPNSYHLPPTYILAWTTTPWTLPSNCALGFGRDHEYSLVQTEEGNYWLASDAVERTFGEEAEVIETKIGKDFVGMTYEPLFPFFAEKGDAKRFEIIHDDGDYVTTDSGTGIVHMAPFFGAEDDDLCKKFGIEGVNPIDDDGRFNDLTPPLKGKYFRYDPEVDGTKEDNANKWVIATLKESGKLFKLNQIRHSYPHCWRTDCALMYRGITTWFVKVSAVKEAILAQNQNINWHPKHLRDGRFGKLLEGAPDWAISRNRYWGTPLPIWRCDKTGAIEVIGSREDLEAKVGKPVDDLHKHFVDDLTWKNPETGGTMRRIEEVLDCWFESGSMPYASIHYPFEGKEFQTANFISEGMDQTRGWFYTLHVLGTALFGKNIFKNVICHGIVLAEDGQKMSKSKKNYPDPKLIFDKYGADAMRFYLMKSPVTKGENLRFAEHEVEEVLKSLILPLRNAYQFLSMYANIDDWKPTKFTWVRHGEAAHNEQSIYCGNPENCGGLTELGKNQAKAAGDSITKVDQLYSSPMPRTQQTAALMNKGEATLDARLTEIDFGELEGKPWEPVQSRLENPTTEALDVLQHRVREFIQETATKHPGEHIAVVSHGGVIKAVQTGHLYGNRPKADHLDFPIIKTGNNQVIFPLPQSENELDRWIMSELQTLVKTYREAFDLYDLEHACRCLPVFVDKLNNWYLRRNRSRFWATGLDADKQAGYATLHYVLLTLSKLLAPICPFFAEELYQGLINETDRSVHLEFMPLSNESLIDEKLEAQTDLTREVVRLAASIRAKEKIKLRQPLNKLQFALSDPIELDLELIAAEANVKTVEILQDLEGVAEQIIKVDARQVGRKYGKKVQAMIQAGKSGNFTLKDNGQVEIEGETLEIGEYELGFITEGDLQAEATHQVVVLLDTELSEKLMQEGQAREIIRAVQELRKSSGFEVTDRIQITYETDDETVLQAFTDMITAETLADSLTAGSAEHTLSIEGLNLKLSLAKS